MSEYRQNEYLFNIVPAMFSSYLVRTNVVFGSGLVIVELRENIHLLFI